MAGLNNSDFRKLLETPRAERWGSETPSAKPQAAAKPKGGGDYRPHKPHGKPGGKKPVPHGRKDDDEDDDGPKYRDRAEERRRGKNLDYEDAQAVLSALAGGGGGGAAGGVPGLAGGDLGGVDLSKLSEEETKYLGGDMRFTHLVKGLDYALLHKTRNEITKKGDDGEEDEEEGGEAGAKDPEAARDAQVRAAVKANTASGAKRSDMRISTPLARSVYSTLFEPSRTNVRDMYLPRRTAFVFDFDNEDSFDTDVPTTLRRPKSECPPPPDVLFAGVDNAVLDRIARIMSYVRTTADGKKLKKKDRDAILGIKGEQADAAQQQDAAKAGAAPGGTAAAATGGGRSGGRPAGPVDDDDDIFGDAGNDYKPTYNKKGGKAGAQRDQGEGRRPDGSYFDSKDTMADIPMAGTNLKGVPHAAAAGGGGDDMELEDGEMPPPPPPPPPPSSSYGAGDQQHAGYGNGYGQQQQAYGGYGDQQQQQGYGYGGYGAAAGGQQQQQQQGGDLPKWRSRPKDPKARSLDAEDDDAYGEYYPGMVGAVGAIGADSDEEGGPDLAAMDSKNAKGMTRADFATDEEWTRYKEQKETLPRAAFQFGVKRADGRKSHKELEKGASRDQKLNSQLRNIERVLKEKGHDHAGAFTKAPKAPAEAPPEMTPSVRGKRQRI